MELKQFVVEQQLAILSGNLLALSQVHCLIDGLTDLPKPIS